MGPLVLIGKDPVLEGSTNKIEDKQVPGTCKYIYIYFFMEFIFLTCRKMVGLVGV